MRIYKSRKAGVLGGALMALTLGSFAASPADSPKAAVFTLTSSDPLLSRHLPEIYAAHAFGCSGGNTSPPLEWHNPPAGTKSFVLTLFDRDERSTPSGWWHWAMYDIPASTDHLAKGAGAAHSPDLPPGAKEGRTDLGNTEYHGPCPAKGDPPHRYVFTLYALSVATLPVDADAPSAMVTSVAQDSLLGKAVLVIHHGR